MSQEKLIVYTDGATSNNGKKYAKGGIGVFFPNNEDWNVSMSFTAISEEFFKTSQSQNLCEISTNQKSELYAIWKAVTIINTNVTGRSVIIYSDSDYSIKCLTQWIKNWIKNGWKTRNKKPVRNAHIIKSIHTQLTDTSNIYTFIHVNAAHDNREPVDKTSLAYQNWYGNTVADYLAVQGKK